MDVLIKNLLKLNQKKNASEGDLKKFQTFVEELDLDEVEALISSRILFTDGYQIIQVIFQGLSQKGPSQKKRVKLFEFIMSEIQTKDMPESVVTPIVNWLVMVELDKLTNTHLIRISDLCVSLISNNKSGSHTCWKDLLPNIINLLSHKKEVEHYGSEMTGDEYKKQVISTLCQAVWNSDILTPIAAMFTNIQLSNEEHDQIVRKLCSRFEELQPSEVPSLVHQMLILTKQQHSMTLFFALKRYYNKYIYKLEDSSAMLDSTKLETPDSIECIAKREVIENESMVLYHIKVCAKRSFGCTTDLVRSAKASMNAPESFLDPFLLAVLLMISNVPSYEVQIHDIIRSMIIRVIEEEEKQYESDWLRKVLGTHCDVEQIITKLIRSSVCEQEGVLQGLVGLSKCLLRTGARPGKAKIASKVWHCGRMIVVNVIKKHNQVANYLLGTITDTIINRPDVTQYTDCLAELCDTSPLLVVECPNLVSRLCEFLPRLPERSAHMITGALITLIQFSTKVRDTLILVFRKLLFKHDVGTRKMAVIGFLQLLKRLKVRGMHSLSQNSFQIYTCPSIFTQSNMDVHSHNQPSTASNEGICLEVIGVLRRCFMQQLPVKICLYNGLHRALLQNPELSTPVSNLLVEHLSDFYESDEDILPPLNFSKTIMIQQNDVTVQEPLGHLIFLLCQLQVSNKMIANNDYDNYDTGRQNKIETIIESLIERFSKCELKHMDLDNELDGSPEGRFKEEMIRECIGIYEALIGYIISSWDASVTEEYPKKLFALYRAHNNMTDFAKNVKMSKKEDLPRRRTGQRDTTTTATKKALPFLFPEIVLNFETVIRFLTLLIEESVSWSTDSVAKEVKCKRPLHRFAMRCCLSVISKTRSQLQEYKSKSMFKNSCDLAKLLYERCLCRFEEYMEFDMDAAVSGLECFTELCSLIISNFKIQLPAFLEEVCEEDRTDGLNAQIEKLIKIYLKNFSKSLDVEEDDQENPQNKKLMGILTNGINLLALELPNTESCINKVLRWLNDLTQQTKIASIPITKTLISLLLTLLFRCKSETSLHDNLALQLCKLFGTINDTEAEKPTAQLEMVNDSNKAVVLPLLCLFLNSRLDAVNWIILRLKAEFSMISQPDASSSNPGTRRGVLKRKEKEIVQELGLIVSATQWVATIEVPLGPLPELIARLLHHNYTTLTAFTKYFLLRSSNQNPAYQEARFAKLVKLSASHLSSQVAEFLLYIETADKMEGNEKKLNAKILRQSKKQMIYIPKLVAELENFTKCVTQLSIKCKDPSLVLNVKLTTTRDFRLNTKRLEEVLKRTNESDSDEGEEDLKSVHDEGKENQPSGSKSSSSQKTSSQKSNTSKRSTKNKRRKT